mmetsp:Transcript_112662/g.319110  ORF Transcript_112662/g.319110 Transcript_112662/m.319110 type:complete len:248 (-) Transcript_112662:140-883(-)
MHGHQATSLTPPSATGWASALASSFHRLPLESFISFPQMASRPPRPARAMASQPRSELAPPNGTGIQSRAAELQAVGPAEPGEALKDAPSEATGGFCASGASSSSESQVRMSIVLEAQQTRALPSAVHAASFSPRDAGAKRTSVTGPSTGIWLRCCQPPVFAVLSPGLGAAAIPWRPQNQMLMKPSSEQLASGSPCSGCPQLSRQIGPAWARSIRAVSVHESPSPPAAGALKIEILLLDVHSASLVP